MEALSEYFLMVVFMFCLFVLFLQIFKNRNNGSERVTIADGKFSKKTTSWKVESANVLNNGYSLFKSRWQVAIFQIQVTGSSCTIFVTFDQHGSVMKLQITKHNMQKIHLKIDSTSFLFKNSSFFGVQFFLTLT